MGVTPSTCPTITLGSSMFCQSKLWKGVGSCPFLEFRKFCVDSSTSTQWGFYIAPAHNRRVTYSLKLCNLLRHETFFFTNELLSPIWTVGFISPNKISTFKVPLPLSHIPIDE